MKKVHLAVSEFALPAPRRGSIDPSSGFSRGAAVGLELHQRLQTQRQGAIPGYVAEEVISQEFERGGFTFVISGRLDGVVHGEVPWIEEMKSSFNIFELRKRLLEEPDLHPYCLQLKTYGYFYFLQHQKMPLLKMTLISSRNFETSDFFIPLHRVSFEKWLELRLEELVQEAKLAEKRAKRRRKAAGELVFPFPRPRPGQVDLIQTLEKGMSEQRPLLIQAPTGLGKTVGVLYPALKEALARGQQVIYVTPKNSQHQVAEDAIERLNDAGGNVRAMTLTAKSKICFKNEPICNPDFCEFAKDHYTKMADNKVSEQLAKKRSLTKKGFVKIAQEAEVCPFEVQMEAVRDADAVICDYNYVFAPRSALSQVGGIVLDQQGRSNLVIDEAHNLPGRAMDFYSPTLSSVALERLAEGFKNLPRNFRVSAREHLDSCLAVLRKCGPADAKKPLQVVPPVAALMEQEAALRQFLSEYLAADVDIQPDDPILRLSFYWSEFTNALSFVSEGRSEFFTTFHPSPAALKITCCDASEMLEATYEKFEQVIAFSATLKPFEYYRKLMGLPADRLQTAEFVSPFAQANRKILIVPQISTKAVDREKSAPRIAEAIAKIVAVHPGNYFAFFPSFDFMERVAQQFQVPAGFSVLKQDRRMRREDIDTVIETLRDAEHGHVVFAVQGGVFSEGVDYPGDMIIGAFIVGPPLPTFDLEREKMRDYFEKNYGAGFDYAYTYPAMAKAVQAAGRVIRSETDRGLIVLMDPRFLQDSYVKSMPEGWFKDSPRELISDSILKDVTDFWGPRPKKN